MSSLSGLRIEEVYNFFSNIAHNLKIQAGQTGQNIEEKVIGTYRDNGKTYLYNVITVSNPDQSNGKPPLIIAGTPHGDEYQYLKEAIGEFFRVASSYSRARENFGEIHFLPVTSAGPLESGTRKNSNGIDVNRTYYLEELPESSKPEEVILTENYIRQVLNQWHNNQVNPYAVPPLILDIHGDNGVPDKLYIHYNSNQMSIEVVKKVLGASRYFRIPIHEEDIIEHDEYNVHGMFVLKNNKGAVHKNLELYRGSFGSPPETRKWLQPPVELTLEISFKNSKYAESVARILAQTMLADYNKIFLYENFKVFLG